jgi:hypothetical protein
MICIEFVRLEEGWKVDGEYRGYGNANLIEVFEMEGVDIVKKLNAMKIGESLIYNIGWYPGCGIKKRGMHSEVVEFGD